MTNIFSLIHKNCHPKSYHSDIKLPITLNIMFSVVLKRRQVGDGDHMSLIGFHIDKLQCLSRGLYSE